MEAVMFLGDNAIPVCTGVYAVPEVA